MQQSRVPCFLIFAAMMATLGCQGSYVSEYELTVGGGSTNGSEHPGFVFGSPNFIKISDQPGVLFAWLETPDGQRQITYMVLFAQNWDTDFKHSDQLDRQFEQNVTITHGEREIEMAYRMNPESKAKLNAVMTLDSKDIDLKQGQLFLISDSVDGQFEQIKAEFPVTEVSLRDPDEIQTYALNALRLLRKNKQVDDFCRQAKR